MLRAHRSLELREWRKQMVNWIELHDEETVVFHIFKWEKNPVWGRRKKGKLMGFRTNQLLALPEIVLPFESTSGRNALASNRKIWLGLSYLKGK